MSVQYFVRSFIRFLNKQAAEGNFPADMLESLEVAVQCLQTVYELNDNPSSSAAAQQHENHPLNHVDLYELFHTRYVEINPMKKQESEKFKLEGNERMKSQNFKEALDMYTKAIDMDATNPVLYCNRAAAYSRLGLYEKAIDDSKISIRYNPQYSKAYGRLGLAYSKMDRHQEALAAYRQALLIEPQNEDYQNNLAVTQQRLQEQRARASGSTAGCPPNISDCEMPESAAENQLLEDRFLNALQYMEGGDMSTILRMGNEALARIYPGHESVIVMSTDDDEILHTGALSDAQQPPTQG